MDKQSGLVNPKSLEVCGSHEAMSDEFEEYSEEESLGGEEQNEEGSSDEESAEVPGEGESDGEDSDAEDSDEELEDASEEDSEEDGSVENIIEEDISEESDEEPNVKEPLKGSVDQSSHANDSDVPNLLELKKTSDADVPQASSRRRRSGWDIKAEVVTAVNASGDEGKKRETRWSNDVKVESSINASGDAGKKKTRWSSDVKAEASTLVNDSTDVNKRRKTRWSSDEAQTGIALLPDSLKCHGDLQKLNEKLQMLNQRLEDTLMVNLDPSSQAQSTSGKQKEPPIHNFTFCKKVYVPSKEYPGYNFIGLILGPRGNSLRKMEEETGATIRLRGKGSNLKRSCPYDHEELHVLIEADIQSSVDAAASKVEKLFVPVEDNQNYHKAAQLRELSEIRTLEGGKTSLAVKIDPCDICGMSTHSTSGCPLTATEMKTNAKVMAETYVDKQIDPARVYVGRLPYSLSCEKLRELFLPYGSLSEATVMFHNSTGISKGYGIVKYMNPSDASNAIEKMNGYRIDGKQLVVRIAGTSPPIEEYLLNNPGLDSTHPTPSTANLPISSGLAVVPQSSSNAILTSYSGLSAIPPPSLNANLPSYPGLAAIPPTLSANLPSYPGLASIPPSSSCANLPTYPGLASSKTNLPRYPGFSDVPLSSSSTILPSYTGLASIPSSSSSANPPSFTGLASIHLSSSNANIPSFPQPIALPPSCVNANLQSKPRPPTIPLPITDLPNYPGCVDIPHSNPAAKLPLYSGPDVLHPFSSNANLQSYTGFPPYSLSTNLASYPELAATPSNSNLPSYGLSSMHLSSLNADQPSYPRPATLSPSTLNAKVPIHSGPAVLPSSTTNAYRSNLPSFSATNPPSNVNLPSYPSFAPFPPSSSNGNLQSERNTWPGPPGSVLSESASSLFKSSQSSLAQRGMPLQSSSSLDKNLSLLEGNESNYTGFAGVPSELATFPGYLKSMDAYPFNQSVPSKSLPSQPPVFTKNFSGNQINPTLRNYNHPSSN